MAALIARLVFRSEWPLSKLLWRQAHIMVGWLAWNFARPDGPTWGISHRINRAHPLWRLNDWVAGHWTDWWVHEWTGRQR